MNPHPQTTFDSLYVAHDKLVRAVVSRTLRRADEVDDVAQAVWLECWRAVQAGQRVNKGWITLRAQSRAWDRREQLSSQPESLDALAERENDVDGDDHPLDHLLAQSGGAARFDRGLIEYIRSGVDTLSPALRDTLNAHYYRGLSISEIALEEGVPVGTVKRRLHDAREQLRAMFLPKEDAA